MRRHVLKLTGLTLLVSLGLLAVATWKAWDFTCDDSFITFRYSKNLVCGIGPTYNVGPPRAEGYTSFLWMALMAVPHLAGGDAVAAAKAMGVALTLLTVAACFGIAWSLCDDADRSERALSAALAAALFATYHLSAMHAVSGMETALATFLLSLLVWLVVRDGRAVSPMVPCCALLLGLTRPEMNLASVTLLVAVFLRLDAGMFVVRPSGRRLPESNSTLRAEARTTNGGRRRRFLAWVALFYVAPGLVYFLWRWSYYQSFLPLPFYMKAATLTPRGLLSAASFATEVAACFGVLLALSLVNLRSKSLPVVAVILIVGLYLFLPEHVMGYGHRFFHPLVPLMAALSARGAAFVLSAVRERLGQGRVAVAYVALLVLGLAPVFPRNEIVWAECVQYAQGMNNAHIRLGKLLAGYPHDNETVLSIGDAGAAPYYSEWETVDSTGLNDPHIAKTGDHSASYVLGHRPSLVVVQSKRPDVFVPHLPWERELFEECRRRGMARVGVLEFRPDFYLWILASPDSSLAKRLRTDLVSPG